ncbi:MAG: TIGR04084 family radical SAM/SPASM domain-containing protein [Candidatus Bathyarchaeia archaeon]|jgi:putative peptide-modifying radical SAM enzyme
MNFYVTLTTNCNQRCKYCYGKSCEDFGSDFHGLTIDYSVPSSVNYQIDALRKFLEHDGDPVLIFYGGEPLLKVDKMKETMDAIPNAHFAIQTNGLLLDRLESKYLNRLDSIFVSLDGDEKTTDHYRGEGTYKRVASNLKAIRERGFSGEIVARMTVAEETEIDTQVLALINGDDVPISSVHWQLDALFFQNDYPKRRFSEWAADNYNPRLRRLIRTWVDHMKDSGEVWRLYPFVGVMQSMLNRESNHLRCGAGWCVFNIQTDGNITPCPVMAGMKDFYLGSIRDASVDRLKDAAFVSEPCTSCEVFDICGGRCLYANVTNLWGAEGFKEVCGTVVNMIEALRGAVPEIKSLIETGKIQQKDFGYPKFNGAEIIP